MKTILTRSATLAMTLVLLAVLLVPWAAAVTYPGVPEITINAKSALLIDLDTEQLLYEQDAHERRYPASITKIMTCLLTLEAIGRGELSMDTVVTIPAEALVDVTDDSSTAGLLAGEEVTVNDLLYCLMLASANEAANALAIAVAGDVPSFVERMNQRAEELGMTDTHFVNPHGLHNDDHYTTAWDIYLMAKEAMTHAPFREIVSTGRYDTAVTNMSDSRQLYNTNGLLARYKYPGHVYSGTIGIKTGSTSQAGYCLCAAAKKKGHTLVSVVLGADNPSDKWGNPIRNQFIESRKLLDWGFTSFSPATLLSSETYLQEVPVKNSFQSTHVVLQPIESVKTLVPGEYDPELLELRLHLADEDAVAAPINAGDVLGTVTVIYNGQDFGTIDMAAVSDVSYSPFLAFVSGVNAVLGNLFVRLALLIALILIVVGVTRRYLSEQHQLRKQARKERQAVRRQQAQARKEQTAREQAAYEARQAEKRRQQEEARKRKEEAERIRRQQEEERRRRQEEEAERRRDRERRRQAELERRWQEEQARREQELRDQERYYGARTYNQRQRDERSGRSHSYNDRYDDRSSRGRSDRRYPDRDRRWDRDDWDD